MMPKVEKRNITASRPPGTIHVNLLVDIWVDLRASDSA